MKIAQVTFRFDAPGGVETCVREVGRRCVQKGDPVSVYASDLYDEGRWERRTHWAPNVDGMPVQRFPLRRYPVPGVSMPSMIGLIDALAAGDADVIHAHSHRYGHVLQSALVARERHIPLVVSTHYHPADATESPIRRGLLRVQDVGFGASAYRVARALVVETELEARLVREFSPGDRIHIIPPGIDLSLWSAPSARTVNDLPNGYFLFIGRIAPNKGLPVLVDALAEMPPAERRPLILMGSDWGERAAVEARARARGVSDLVRFLGHVDDEERYRAIVRGAAVFVLPSEWEAFGLVLLEAMAAGVPIVATSVGGVPEVLDGGRAGRLVPYGDAPRLAEALRETFAGSEPARRRTAAASERVRAYDWDVTAERHRALYRSLLN
jgi:phosphatidylinositol alpha-mannosyltransferase